MLNPCAREAKARTGRTLKEKLMSDHGLFLPTKRQEGAVHGQDSWGFFRDAQGFGRLVARAPASPAQGLTALWTSVVQFSPFPYDV